MIRYAVLLIAAPLLAACGDDPAPVVTEDSAAGASGDVLEGSISDEMLPLDRLESTSPPAGGGEGGDDAAETDPSE